MSLRSGSIRRFITTALLLLLAVTASAATATSFVPSAAPHGARAVVLGTGLDAANVEITFAAAGGSRVSASIVTRSATMIELIVPPSATSGPVHVTVDGLVLAPLPFTLTPDPLYTRVVTLAASDKAHDILKSPSHVAMVASTGVVVVADTNHHRILAVGPGGNVTVLAGSGAPALRDGAGTGAQFNTPRGIAVDDLRRRIYVADTGNHVIRAVTYDGVVTTLAGSGRPDDAFGTGAAAAFKQPTGLALDAAGNLYVADTGNSRIKLVTPTGIVGAVAGAGHDGLADGAASLVLFKEPEGIAVSPSGALVVADTMNNVIRKIEGGTVTTIAGTGHAGWIDGPAARAEFKQPSQLSIDDAGNVWVADTQNSVLRVVNAFDSSVATIAGTGKAGYLDGAPSSALFNGPAGLAVAGALFVDDSGNDALRVMYAELALTALFPRSGAPAGGTVVRIFGQGFVAGATGVAFGDIQAADVTFVSATEVVATAPAHLPGTVDVRVTAPGGSVTLTNAFTYLPPPTLTSVAPQKGKTSGGETLTLLGTNFMNGETTVTVGGAPATAVNVISPSTLSATTPPGAAGPADVKVATPAGSAAVTNAFTYFAPPTIASFAPSSARVGDTVTISGANFDPDPAGDRVTIGSVAANVTSASAGTLTIAVPQGASSAPITVGTAGGNTTSNAPLNIIVYLGVSISPASVTLDPNQALQLTLTATLAGGGTVDVTALASWSSANPSLATVTGGLVRGVAIGSTTISATLSGLQASVPVVVRSPEPLPPDPATVATKIDPTVVGMFLDEVKFLYTGANPIQTGVAAGAIDENRAATVRGTVKTREGFPLSGVTVSVLGHPEFGQTLSRADGTFDLVINGGGQVALQFAKNNFIGSQRSVTTIWGQQTVIDGIVMLGYDPQVTAITLGAPTEQVARATTVTDAEGTRRATLRIPPGTTAVLKLRDGSTQAASTLHVRATEFTVGPNGRSAMPATLPSQSAYTYCVELSADEAVSAGASDVQFSKPLALYIENFLGFAPGMGVPVGYYDRQRAGWVASDNGIVLKIISVTNGVADVDVNGDGIADDASNIGIDATERQSLAALYVPGQTLWRVPVSHFTPWDPNLSGLPAQALTPVSAVSPNQPQPLVTPAPSSQDASGTICHASAVNCYSATLSESIPVVGTSFSLDYDSSRVAPTQNAMTIFLSGATLPEGLRRIDLAVTVAGTKRTFSFAPQPNLTYDFTWDGLDVFGRRAPGARDAGVLISYVYDSVYALPAPGGRSWDELTFRPTGVRGRGDISLSQAFTVKLGHFDVATAGFGTWSFSPQHFYDGRGGAIYDAGGAQRSGDPNQNGQLAVTNYAGTGSFRFSGDGGLATSAGINAPNYIAAGPDGAVYICDSPILQCSRIRRIDPNTHIINTIAGTGFTSFTADGNFALGNPISAGQLAVGPDNTLYFVDGNRVRRIVDGILTTIAGNGSSSFGTLPPDGSVATQVPVTPQALAVGRDGSVYISQSPGVSRITTDGRITTVLVFRTMTALAVGPGGELYGTDSIAVYKIAGGVATVIGGVTGNTTVPSLADGQPATSGTMSRPNMLAVAADGTILVSEVSGKPRVRAIAPNGIATTVMGTGSAPDFSHPPLSGTLGRSAPVGPWGVTVSGDGSIYIIDQQLGLVRRAANVFPPLSRVTALPSPDGSAAYVFENGRHTSTVDTLTGTTLLTLTYDGNGFLTKLTDLDGNVTTIERQPDGTPNAIVAPGGQRTTLSVTNGVLLGVTNPADESVSMAYDSGLLSDYHDARHGLHHYTYDAKGLVTRDDAPDGSFFTLTRSGAGQNYTVTRTTAEGRRHTYKVNAGSDTTTSREHDQPDGTALKTQFSGGTTTSLAADGATLTVTDTPDPRFGMAAPFAGTSVAAAGGQQLSILTSRSITSDAANPLAVASLTQTFTLNGRRWSSTYSGGTRLATLTSPMGRTTTSTLDAKGRTSSITLPGMTTVNVAYGDSGLLASIIQGSRTTTLAYDTRRRLSGITDALHRTVQFGYDDADRLTTQTFADGRSVAFAYDASGNITSVTPPSRPAHAFTFTPADLAATYTAPSAAPTSYTYNHDRQLVLVQRPDGSTITPQYDGFGRLSSLALGRGSYSYAYDATTGQVRTVTTPGGDTLAYTYAGPLPVTVQWSGAVTGAVSFTYNSDFKLASEGAGDGAAAFTYDSDGLLSTAGALTLQRDAQTGFVMGSTIGNFADSFTYNSFGEVLTYGASVGGSPLYVEAVVRDDAGRISRKTETLNGASRTFDYFYDPAGRLSDVISDGDMTTSYRYDANGNRQQQLINGRPVADAAVDDQDRLLSYGDTTYTYTAAGDLASQSDWSGITTYTYDELGALMHVGFPNGMAIDYVIDGQNRRVGKRRNGILVQAFLYADVVRIVAELDGTGAVVSRFVYGARGNVPAYMLRNGATYRIVTDHLGSPRLVVDTATGAVAQQIDYDAFGNVMLDTNPGFQPFGFAGGLYDADTRLVRFGTRDYDPATGRWTAKDPEVFAGRDANLYSYVRNNPISLIDPMGTDWVDTTANVSAGIGDALLLGFGDELREWTDRQFGWSGGASVDRCSGTYRVATGATSAAMLAVGSGRIAYAAGAKGIALGAETVEEAVAARNTLKVAARLGLNQTARVYSTEQILSKYGSAEEAIAAAGRTNTGFNAAGAAAIAGGINALLNQPDCGCR